MELADKVLKAEKFTRWLDTKLDGLAIQSDLRSRLAAGCLDLALEHQKSILLLVTNRLYGSAFSLVRLTFEAFVRGVWLYRCATESDLEAFEKDTFRREFGVLVADVERVEGFSDGVLSSAKQRSWAAMNSFTHCGFHQVARRNTEESIEPDYPEDEVVEALNFATAIGLLSALQIAHLANDELLANEVFQWTLQEIPDS